MVKRAYDGWTDGQTCCEKKACAFNARSRRLRTIAPERYMDLSENLESTSTERHLTRDVHLQSLSCPNTLARMGRGFGEQKKEMTENGTKRAYDGWTDGRT